MSEEIKSQDSKEIDLLDVTGKAFSSIGRGIMLFFGWIKSLIVWFFQFSQKYFWLLAILTILGGVAGYMKARMQKPYYETEMLVESQIVSRAQIAERINNLQGYIDDRNVTGLSKELGLPQSAVKSISFIKADIVNVKIEMPKTNKKRTRTDEEGKEIEEEVIDEELGPQFIRIRVRLWDNKIIPNLGQAILTFVESDPYISERLQIVKQSNVQMRENITQEIMQLELFQAKNIERNSTVMTFGNSPLMVQAEEKTYITEILALKAQILELESAYKLTKPLTIIQPFTPFEQPVDRKLINTILFALMFFAVGYSLLFIREHWNKL